MKAENADDSVVFRTGRLYELDMAKEALAKAKIPYVTQRETFAGLIEAMPLIPVPARGTFWSILVPQQEESNARKILSALPIELWTNPDIRDFAPFPLVKSGLRVFVIGMTLIFLIWLIKALV